MDETLPSSKIIIQGEASESEEEEEDIEVVQPLETRVDNETTQDVKDVQTGVVVRGEAPESDDEFEMVTNDGQILPLNVNPSESGDSSFVSSPTSPTLPSQQRETKPKYNTLLNRKLRERNIALRRHLVDTIHQSYQMAAKDLHNLTSQLQKSHIAIQDVSHHMRNATNDLFRLEDKVEIVSNCMILPDINIPLIEPVSPVQN